MGEAIKLSLIVERDTLFHKEIFTDDCVTSYLGSSLKERLLKLLDELSPEHGPIVKGIVHSSAVLEGRVYVAENAKVGPHSYIQGPCYIGPEAEVRHAAFIRGNVYIGPKAVVGHTTEVKGSIFFDGAKAGHFAYVGDSILGKEVNLGAGTKLANLRLDHREVKVTHPLTKQRFSSGLKKLGAILGDFAQTGCNSVLSPGTVLMPSVHIMPCDHAQGTITKLK